ncbi:polysaccharide deacetylase family protein [Plantactinospora siamensis]|uniref:Polysaccharide deacetylase family protein n=1 Tax=Plantactinospora siamensis TaxID=555372 RepID=A0ABV6P360_9ACTN
MGIHRRQVVTGALLAAGGAAAGAALVAPRWPLGPDRLPISGGYAPAGVARVWSARGEVPVVWHVSTTEPLVALTFDDGPGPRWTPMVLDILDRAAAPATFMMVGERLTRYADLLRGRLGRHEVGNHTWAHRDLAELDEAGVRDQLERADEAIRRLLGRTPTLMRPPWGHLGGSTLTVADEFGYDVVMWSQQMREEMFQHDPPAQVTDIVDNARRGSIVLAHDVGADTRLVALRQLGAMIDGLRGRGFRLVTVSELLAAATPPSTPRL